jgi:hypothetical protein
MGGNEIVKKSKALRAIWMMGREKRCFGFLMMREDFKKYLVDLARIEV